MEFIPYNKKAEENKNYALCQKCKGTGIVKEEDKSVHVCWDCLNNGRLDVHSKNLPDTDVSV